jgi:hypothetical protein
MRNSKRDAAERRNQLVVSDGVHKQSKELDPVTKGWLDNVIIPILLKKLRQQWNEEKVA